MRLFLSERFKAPFSNELFRSHYGVKGGIFVARGHSRIRIVPTGWRTARRWGWKAATAAAQRAAVGHRFYELLV
jgi:hypothetical protein